MCKHQRLKCVNNVLSCMDCGAVLPLETLTAGKYKPPQENAPEGPKKAAKRNAKKEAE